MSPIALTVVVVVLLWTGTWLALRLRMWRLERRWRRRAHERSRIVPVCATRIRSDGEQRERERYIHHAWRPVPRMAP